MKAKTAFGFGCVCGQLAKLGQVVDLRTLDEEQVRNLVTAEIGQIMSEIERLVNEEEEDAEEG